jgi:hypothetical protein
MGFLTQGLPLATTANGAYPFTGSETFPADTNTSDGINPSQIGVTFAQAATYFSGGLPWVTGRFYGLPDGTTPVAILTVTATLYAYPIYVPSTVTVSTLNIGVTTGQTGGAARAGIYADNGAGYPGELIYDSGAIAGLTSTTVVTKTDVDTELAPGVYWIATIFTATSTFPSVTGITANYGVVTNTALGSDTAAHALATSGQAATGISVAGTYGALPTTFTAGATLTLNAATPVVVLGV